MSHFRYHKRIYEHKNTFVEGFTKKYDCKNLVCFEIHNSIEEAIKREKQLKKWKREWKENLIKENNPDWEDLYNGLLE